MKIDNLGNIINSITIQGFSPTSCVFTADSSIVIAGVDINYNNILKKFDYAGNEIWNRQLTGNNLSYLTHILITNDSGYFFVGNGNATGPLNSVSFHFILKLTDKGIHYGLNIFCSHIVISLYIHFVIPRIMVIYWEDTGLRTVHMMQSPYSSNSTAAAEYSPIL